jgi:flavin reductase (DIM6/NTAB) family NADH-FMN oxidoreductase RutF
VKRNPHGNFKEVEASRQDWREDSTWTVYKTKNPSWKPGQGSNDNGEWKKHKHIAIDPYQDGRPATFNYKLLISAIVPRPIGFVSTRSKDGSSTNLAPFSYTQVINHDPPIFIVGYAGGFDKAKDSLRNLVDSEECVINIVSEHYLEAANATSVNAPYGISEWALTGLTPKECTEVRIKLVCYQGFWLIPLLSRSKQAE